MHRLLIASLEEGIELLLKQLREEKTEPSPWAECLPAEEAAHLHRRITVLDKQIEELCHERTSLVGEASLRNDAFRRHLAEAPASWLEAETAAGSHEAQTAEWAQLPKWLPRSVAIEARWWLPGGTTPPGCRPPRDETAGWRLATDYKMQHVWRFLEHPRRGGHRVPCLNSNGAHSAECHSQLPTSRCAFRTLFREAIWLRTPLVSHDQAIEEARRDRTWAAQLRTYHEELEEQPSRAAGGFQEILSTRANYDSRRQRDWASPFSSDVLLRDKYPVNVLLELAAFHEARARWLESRTPASAVVRKKTDPDLYNFIGQLSRVTRNTFGSPLYGVVATITTVLFEVEDPGISPDLVRSIGRARSREPIDGGRKTAANRPLRP
jgi:hypothetical protein